jgi:hypothetical protein
LDNKVLQAIDNLPLARNLSRLGTQRTLPRAKCLRHTGLIRRNGEAEESILGYKESKENFQEVNTKAEGYGKG